MDIKQKQEAYHDWEAQTYEEKFSISYDERCIEYARDRFRKVVPEGAGFGRVLEVGAGTGFFLINLALGGCLEGAELEATDISQGMLDVCRAQRRRARARRSRPDRVTPRRCPTTTAPSTSSSATRSSTTSRSPVRRSGRCSGSSSRAAARDRRRADRARRPLSWVVKRNTYRAFRGPRPCPV
jgi:hypothetical protein